MSLTVTGNSEPQLLRADPQYIRGQGWVITLEYRGLRADIEGIAGGLSVAGYDWDITADPPLARLTATKYATNPQSSQDYYDRYTIRKETVEKSIWSLPAAQSEGSEYTGGFGAYRADIKEALEGEWDEGGAEGHMISKFGAKAGSSYPVAWQLYLELARGAEAFEEEYIVLSRERVVSLDYASKLQLQPPAARTLYTKAQLQAAFDVPEFTGIEWPSEGDAVPQAAWRWRNRNYEVRFVESDRVQINQDWVWAAWSTNLYSEYA